MNEDKKASYNAQNEDQYNKRVPIERCRSANPRSDCVKLNKSLNRNSIDLGQINIQISTTKQPERKSILKKNKHMGKRVETGISLDKKLETDSKMYPSSILGIGILFS